MRRRIAERGRGSERTARSFSGYTLLDTDYTLTTVRGYRRLNFLRRIPRPLNHQAAIANLLRGTDSIGALHLLSDHADSKSPFREQIHTSFQSSGILSIVPWEHPQPVPFWYTWCRYGTGPAFLERSPLATLVATDSRSLSLMLVYWGRTESECPVPSTLLGATVKFFWPRLSTSTFFPGDSGDSVGVSRCCSHNHLFSYSPEA
ncbi:hypothetical protein F5Y13DRAFT_97102 [Hypoxylon sp. FL1857]|nr:hypothetical protein F5Y13DRAFT_97102 [Hypoxylon sp. FL1857]